MSPRRGSCHVKAGKSLSLRGEAEVGEELGPLSWAQDLPNQTKQLATLFKEIIHEKSDNKGMYSIKVLLTWTIERIMV